MRKQFFDMSFGTLCLALSIVAATFFALCSMLLAPCSSAQAQQPTQIPRIGFLSATSLSSTSVRVEAFRQGLRELGYVEGQEHCH